MPAHSRLPYQVRLKNYHKEKDELFYQLKDLSPAEIEQKQRELVRKWRV